MDFLKSLFDNTLVSGGLILMLTGAILALCRSLPHKLLDWMIRAFTLKVEILERRSELFDWLTIWLDRQPYSKRARLLSASVAYQEGADPRVSLSPGTGWHLFRYHRKWLFLKREKLSANQSAVSAALEREQITLHCFGRDQSAIRQLLTEALKVGRNRDNQITVYMSTENYWRSTTQVVRRAVDSVILPPGQLEDMVSDLDRFLTSEEHYRRRCIPYHHGVLLQGLPGSGKTSTILALASHFERDIYALNLSNSKMTDMDLIQLLSAVPATAFVLLEQFDVMIDAKNKKGVSFNTLLDVLDGVYAKDGRVLFMTTNHMERLDSTLIRRGRIDKVYDFGYATQDQIAELYNRFYPDAWRHDRVAFVGQYAGRDVTMSDVQSDLLENKYPEHVSEAAD